MEIESLGGSSQGIRYAQGEISDHLRELASLGSETLYSKYTSPQREEENSSSTQARDSTQNSSDHDAQTASKIIVMTGHMGPSDIDTPVNSTGLPSRATTSTPSNHDRYDSDRNLIVSSVDIRLCDLPGCKADSLTVVGQPSDRAP
jgi:hypothetical protein